MAQITAQPLAGNLLGSTDNDFVIAEWRDQGGPPGPPRYIAPLHLHHGDDEAWYVLEGQLVVLVDEDEVLLNPGCAVLVPKGTPHAFWNPGEGLCRYLLIMTPNIHALIKSIHTLETRTFETVKAVFEKHNSTLLG